MESANAKLTTTKDFRLQNARLWLQGLGADLQSDFHNVAGDASFRRYFRVQVNGESRILMDSPPPAEDVEPFVDIDRRLRTAGLYVPEIVFEEGRLGDLLYFICDTEKAQKRLGWQPEVPPREGVKRLLEWLKEKEDLFE